MDNQPEALRLADALEQQFPVGTAKHYLDGDAAAELRRLHAENERLRAAHDEHHEQVAEIHGALMVAQIELYDLRKFHEFFRDRCEMLFERFGMEAVDLYNNASSAALKEPK